MRALPYLIIPLLFSSMAKSADPGQTPTFRTTSQLVLVPVTVTDRKAKTVEGLRANDFSIFDNQTPQQIVSFGSDDAPSSIAVVLDVSGSMQKSLAAARNVLKAFIGASNPADEFLLLTVSTAPAALSGFTTDVSALQDSISYTRPGGLTSLIDTSYMALAQMRKARQPRRALLILSDGIDNHSRYSQRELMNVALEADVQVYSLIFDTGILSSDTVPFRPGMAMKPWDQARARQGPDLLETLSAKTGGLSFHVHSDSDAQDAAVKTGQALRTEYLIGYQPAETASAGQYHHIRVKSNIPKVYVHARTGYYSR